MFMELTSFWGFLCLFPLHVFTSSLEMTHFVHAMVAGMEPSNLSRSSRSYNLLPNSMTDFVCLHHYTTHKTLPRAWCQKEKMLSVPFSAGVNWGSVWKGWMIQSQMPLMGQSESGQLCLMLRPMELFKFGPDENGPRGMEEVPGMLDFGGVWLS